MKKQKNPKREKRKLFKLFSYIFFLQISFSAGASDLLERASNLEREGKNEEARDLYLQWLSQSDSNNSERFGRILIHTLRMPAPLDEDLNLIEKHINRVGSVQDKKDILKTAIILSELSGNNRMTRQYLTYLKDLDHEFTGASADTTLSRITMSLDEKYEYMALLKDYTGADELLLWIDSVHRKNPSLITEPDWLFLLQKVLVDSGYPDQAQIFRTRILEKFPNSVEASLLKYEVTILADPEDLFTGIGLIEEDTIVPEQVQNIVYTFYQAGAFRSYENASRLKADLEQSGLVSIIEKDADSYKVIVESKNNALTLEIFGKKGIKAFRIHP